MRGDDQVFLVEEQLRVAQAEPSARIMVSAGPGTGKTEVACSRVISLVNRGIEPSNIWLVSFTRAAVKEIRNRIYGVIGNSAYSVKIATLDSQAFQLMQGFREDERSPLFVGYDQTIEQVLEFLSSGREEIADYIQEIEHLIVDEAQDIVGIRARLLMKLIDLLSPEAGISVFSDEAQAIYGFSLEDEAGDPGSDTLPELLRQHVEHHFEECKLEEIHRTKSVSLLSIFKETRALVLDAQILGQPRLERVRQSIEEFAESNVGKFVEDEIQNEHDVLVLFRRRAEVLMASSLLSGKRIEHRIRMPGAPACVDPWVAVLLSDWIKRYLGRAEFDDLWSQQLIDHPIAFPDRTDAWALLIRFAGKSQDEVDIYKLRAILTRSRPPIEFVSHELGRSGPMLGTIHSSKGREATRVRLMLPVSRNKDGDHDEEARVLFVGATRAKEKLDIGEGFYLPASRLGDGTGRVFSRNRKWRSAAMIEFGLDGDLYAEVQASRHLFDFGAALRDSQDTLRNLIGGQASVVAKLKDGTDLDGNGTQYLYKLELEGTDTVLGYLSERVNIDLFQVGAQLKAGPLKPPDEIEHLYVVDVRSLVFSADDNAVNAFREPYCDSGIMLAPVIIGFPTVFLQRYRKGM